MGKYNIMDCHRDNFYERLRTEIVRSAVVDLQRELRRSDRLGQVTDEVKKLEEWFLSKWGQMLSGDNGEYIIALCHKTYKLKSRHNQSKPVTKEVEQKAYRDYKAGMPKEKIKKKYNITEYQYFQMIRRGGQ